jgi:hypothetical protein
MLSARCGLADAGEYFRRRQQIVEIGDTQHASPAERCFEGALRGTARVSEQTTRPDGHHGPQPRRGTGGGEKRPPVPQLPDVEQDRTRAGIA